MAILHHMRFSEAIPKFTAWRQYRVGRFTLKGYDNYLKRFCIFTRNPEIENITEEDFIEWFNLMDTVGYDTNSYIPMAEAIRQFFKFYFKLGYKVLNPDLIPIPRKEFKPTKVATKEEYLKLLEASYAFEKGEHDNRARSDDWMSAIRNRALIALFWDTGARIGEVLGLTFAQLDLDNNKAVIRTEKSRGRRPFREIFWTPGTSSFLRDWMVARKKLADKHDCDPIHVFIGMRGRSWGKQVGNHAVYAFLVQYSKWAKLPRIVNAHSFRHHKGHDIVQKGGSMADVQQILGHANITSSQVYVQFNDRELQERADKFLD